MSFYTYGIKKIAATHKHHAICNGPYFSQAVGGTRLVLKVVGRALAKMKVIYDNIISINVKVKS